MKGWNGNWLWGGLRGLPVRGMIAGAALGLLTERAWAGSVTNSVVTSYAVKGVFQEARSGGRAAVIAHEAIPGYMDAMTMPFNVKSPAEIESLRPGDEITFRLSVTDTDDWIDQVKVVSRSRTIKEAQASGAPLLRPDSLGDVGAGELVPDCTLTNQAGQTIRLRDFKGQALAFTFFFSRCPLPTFCPRLHSNFAAVQQALQNDATRTNWQLLSISFDPGYDNPARLGEVALRQQTDSQHWNFATSGAVEVRRLGASFGLQFWRENGTFSHNLRTVVINADGRVQRVLRGNDWQPAELAAEMQKGMRKGNANER